MDAITHTPSKRASGAKAKIERAAVTLFARSSIDGVSTKQIAQAAGVSEGALYRHYSGKDALARTLMMNEHNNIAALLRSVHETPGPLSQKVGAIVDQYCVAADEDWDLFSYYLLHFHRFALNKNAQANDDSPMKAAIDIIKAAQVNGEMPSGEPALRAAMALGVVLQTATAKVYGQMPGPLTPRAPYFRAAVLAVLLSNPDRNA